jgi:AcrR family transcriptional regulator
MGRARASTRGRDRSSIGSNAAAAESGAPARRDRLLEEALELFGRYGVKRTSIDTLAAAAGIAKGSVYLEWRSKDELFRAVAEHLTAGMLAAATTAAAQRELSIVERVTAVLMAKFWRLYELVHSRPHASELIAAKDELAREVFRKADDRFAALVEETLASAKAKEWAPARHGVNEIAAVLLRAAHGNGYAAGARPLGEAAYRRRLQAAVELVLAGARRGK